MSSDESVQKICNDSDGACASTSEKDQAPKKFNCLDYDRPWKTLEDVFYTLDCASSTNKPTAPRKPAYVATSPQEPQAEVGEEEACERVARFNRGRGRGTFMREMELEHCSGYRDAQLRLDMRNAGIVATTMSNNEILYHLNPSLREADIAHAQEMERLHANPSSLFKFNVDDTPLIPFDNEYDYVALDSVTFQPVGEEGEIREVPLVTSVKESKESTAENIEFYKEEESKESKDEEEDCVPSIKTDKEGDESKQPNEEGDKLESVQCKDNKLPVCGSLFKNGTRLTIRNAILKALKPLPRLQN